MNMSHSIPQNEPAHKSRQLVYVLCSLAPLLLSVWCIPVWQRPHRTGLTTDSVGVVLGAIVALNCIWWFVRCPRQHGFAKGLTLMLMIASVLLALAQGYSQLAYRLYGQTVRQ